MVDHAHLPPSLLLRRTLLVALTGVLVVAAMMLSASGASARTRICPRVTSPVASMPHSQLQHAHVCLASRVRVVRHLPIRLPSRKV